MADNFYNLTDIMSDIVGHQVSQTARSCNDKVMYACNTSNRPLIVLGENGRPYLSLSRVDLAGERVLRS